ncbi:MAG: family 10 glycosylhydrolase [Dysgonamonadaceae bacterium]|nr:family 10 glycosylhydrolase [Dysgonamonadaceae bacterium]
MSLLIENISHTVAQERAIRDKTLSAIMISAMAFIFFSFSWLTLTAQPKQEIRAVWLTTNYALDWPRRPIRNQQDVAKQQEELCQILDQLKQANFNIVFFQTRIRGNVGYPSAIEPWSPFIVNNPKVIAEYDPLAFVIEACHRRGLECHAWFVTYPMGAEKINKRPNSSQSVAKNKQLIKKYNGELYLDPGNPQTNTYLLTLVRELVSRYDLDGFHFDYIRYPERNGRSDFPDQDTYKKYGNGQTLSDWRRENINRFAYMAYDTIKAIKPWVQVSSSVLGMYHKIPGTTQSHLTAYSDVFQDPVDWLKQGKHDLIVPMMYYADDLFFPFADDWTNSLHCRYVAPGIGLYRMDDNEENWDVQKVIDQIDYTRSIPAQGNVYYRTRHLTENRKGILSAIKTRFYAYPAQLPPLSWLDNEPPAIPSRPDVVQKDTSLHVSWEVPDDKEPGYYSIYCSEHFPIDTENPENLIATRIHDTEYYLPLDKTKEKGFYYLITASDRYHNESRGSEVGFFYMGSLEK